jgi:hypothetical protein
MRIILTAGGTVLSGTLADNPSSRDFAALLPLTLTPSDHNRTEKIGYLPRRLTTEGAPPATAATTGDLPYYAPWGNWRSCTATSAVPRPDHDRFARRRHELFPGQPDDLTVTIAHAN